MRMRGRLCVKRQKRRASKALYADAAEAGREDAGEALERLREKETPAP